MRIFVLDDEPLALRASERAIKEAVPEAEILSFQYAKDALQAAEKGKCPDVAFSDIEMAGLSGLEFALRLKRISPNTRVIFVTAYSEYAVEAFRLHANGYILKPLTPERIREELACTQQQEEEEEMLQVQCFGYFEIFWKGSPFLFSRRQTKELFAYLVDRKGAVCTAEEIGAAIWEDEGNIKNIKARIRILISDLRHSLNEIGMDDIIIRKSGLIAIRKDRIRCDYYQLLDGDVDAVNAYRGEYMLQYSWAEATAGQLAFGSVQD